METCFVSLPSHPFPSDGKDHLAASALTARWPPPYPLNAVVVVEPWLELQVFRCMPMVFLIVLRLVLFCSC